MVALLRTPCRISVGHQKGVLNSPKTSVLNSHQKRILSGHRNSVPNTIRELKECPCFIYAPKDCPGLNISGHCVPQR